MKAILILMTIWSLLGMAYMWHRIGKELEVEALIDPDEYHSIWHYVAYGPMWWGICILFRVLIFLIGLFS